MPVRAASPCHMLALAGLALRLLGTLAWGPAGGWPGTMDAAHNAALPARMRSYLTNRSVVAYFIGNDTSANSAQEDAAEGRFGIVGVGWQLSAIASRFTGLEQHELDTARRLKALVPGIWAGLQNLGAESVYFPPPEKNELVLSIDMGCADTVPVQPEPNTPF